MSIPNIGMINDISRMVLDESSGRDVNHEVALSPRRNSATWLGISVVR